MPLRKLAGYSKTGKPWVNPHLTMEEQRRIMRHQKTFQKDLLDQMKRTPALKDARKKEHVGLHGQHEILSYEGKIGAKTKQLHGRMSYSPLRKKS